MYIDEQQLKPLASLAPLAPLKNEEPEVNPPH